MKKLSTFLLVLFLIPSAVMANNDPSCWWVPKNDPDSASIDGASARVLPANLIRQSDSEWFDDYTGYFDAQEMNFRWTDEQLDAMKNMVRDGERPVYEFRRGGEGAEYERWDGLWGKPVEQCLLGIGYIFGSVCIIKRNSVEDHSFFWSNLPGAENRGAEEADPWFDIEFSSRYDLCKLTERQVGSDCDEEYEVHFDQDAVEADTPYSIYIRFKVDSDDGVQPTLWQTSFAVGAASWLSKDHDYCVVEEGIWEINFNNADDIDADGMDDAWERQWSLNSNLNDADQSGCEATDSRCTHKGLGLCDCDYDPDGDGVINITEFEYGISPKIKDTDGDGYDDKMEIEEASDPAVGSSIPDDYDNDYIPDLRDTDDDNDGYSDEIETSEGSDTKNAASVPVDNDRDKIPDSMDDDDDNDSHKDIYDALPFNQDEWEDTDGDGIGNIRDSDDDNDNVLDQNDTFPLNVKEWVDTDRDGTGNNADIDDDNDQVADVNDEFPLDAKEWQDTDLDRIGNNKDTDDDNDGWVDDSDSFPLNATEWHDTDSDGAGNNADNDDDGDGYSDHLDAYPLDKSEWVDTDGDTIGDNTDKDDDNDGVLDKNDLFPQDAAEWADNDLDGTGDNADIDDDNDGYPDLIETASGSEPFDNNIRPHFSDDRDAYIAYSPASPEDINLLYRQGDGYDLQELPYLEGGATDWVLFPGDYDGDDETEVVAYEYDGGCTLNLLDDAEGEFKAYEWYACADLIRNLIIIPADLNGDGSEDLFAYHKDGGETLHAFISENGSFKMYLWYTGDDLQTGTRYVPFDINEDGSDDILTYSGDSISESAFISHGDHFERENLVEPVNAENSIIPEYEDIQGWVIY